MRSMFAKLVCEVFEAVCGKWQEKKVHHEPQVFQVRFSKRIDHNKEEGYRHYFVALYAPANYVQVWVREDWNVIPCEDLVYDEEADESFVKQGKDYITGETPWQLIGNHDSCWREPVESFLKAKEKEITTFGDIQGPWSLLPLSKVGLPEVTDAARKGTVMP